MNVLSEKNIYKLSLAEELGRNDLFLLYAPLAGNVLLASTGEVEAIEATVANRVKGDYETDGNEELSDIVDALVADPPIPDKSSKVTDPADFLRMYILPNYICNFSCSYCFSAKGRSNKSLRKEHLKGALDYFICPTRTESRRLAITYLGGGEPTISWELLRFGLEYAGQLAETYSFELLTTVVTNGSRITPEMVDVFSRHRVRVRVSFEILEDVQRKQRGSYEAVCRGLDLLSQCSVKPMVRSMITPDNVRLMPRMIEILHNRFSYVKEVLFDPIISSDTFREADFTRTFYDTYSRIFLQARALADSYGISLKCAPLRNLDMVVERYCTGEFCLTPEGTITICHQVSAPNEMGYAHCIYGQVDESGILAIDRQKFQSLIAEHTIYTHPACKDCYIKWNCGGGCMMQNNQYSEQIREVICQSTRVFCKALLLERLREQFAADGQTLESYIQQNYPLC